LPKPVYKFEYILGETTYPTEEALHSADTTTCVADQHNWKKSFVYGKYSCRNCDATRMKIK
jgi:hypothetical protein